FGPCGPADPCAPAGPGGPRRPPFFFRSPFAARCLLRLRWPWVSAALARSPPNATTGMTRINAVMAARRWVLERMASARAGRMSWTMTASLVSSRVWIMRREKYPTIELADQQHFARTRRSRARRLDVGRDAGGNRVMRGEQAFRIRVVWEM